VRSGYLHIDKEGVLLVAGAYIFTKKQLSATRARLLEESASREFLWVVSDLESAGVELEPGGATPLKSAPRGIDPVHPMIKYLRWKGMMATRRIELDRPLNADSVAESAKQFWRSALALTEWLRD
jgi:hypothetical protein